MPDSLQFLDILTNKNKKVTSIYESFLLEEKANSKQLFCDSFFLKIPSSKEDIRIILFVKQKNHDQSLSPLYPHHKKADLTLHHGLMTAASFPPPTPRGNHTASTVAFHSSDEFAALQPAEKGQYDLDITRRVQPSLFGILIFVRRQRCCCNQYSSPTRPHLSYRL
jgi:hypothetical protein